MGTECTGRAQLLLVFMRRLVENTPARILEKLMFMVAHCHAMHFKKERNLVPREYDSLLSICQNPGILQQGGSPCGFPAVQVSWSFTGSQRDVS